MRQGQRVLTRIGIVTDSHDIARCWNYRPGEILRKVAPDRYRIRLDNGTIVPRASRASIREIK